MIQPLSWLAILFILGAGQGAFLAISLLTSKAGSHIANRYLAFLTLVFTIALFDYFLDLTELNQQYIELTVLLWPKEFFYGVLIYFYVREITQPNRVILRRKQWLHFLPAALHVLITWSVLLLSTDFQASMFADNPPTSNAYSQFLWLFFNFIETLLSMVHLCIYLALSFQLLKQHKRRIKQTFSSIEKINLRWLSTLLMGIVCIYFIWVLGAFWPETHWLDNWFDTFIGVGMVTLVYTMGYFGLRQPQIFQAIHQATEISDTSTQLLISSESETLSSPEKYKNSPLTDDVSLAIVDEIQTFMTAQKPYLDSQLSLPQLAESLNVSTHYLSQIINEQLQQNFFDFINSYRIEEAKRRLTSPTDKNHSILTIAMDAGFNSKSSFYNAFKKSMDMTPTQYRKSFQIKE